MLPTLPPIEVETEDPAPPPAVKKPEPENVASSGNITINARTVINIAAAGLFISFFLPWISFFGSTRSGLDVQNLEQYKLVWAMPAFAVIAFIASVTNQPTKLACTFAAVAPFGILCYALDKMGKDLLQILSSGAWLAMGSAVVLLCIPEQKKKKA